MTMTDETTNNDLSTKFVSVEEILESDDRKIEVVHVPEWGGNVILKVMGSKERDAFELSCIEKKGRSKEDSMLNIRARLLAACLVDQEGNLMFQKHQIDDLGKKSSAVISRLFDKAQRVNLMTDEDIDELSEI